MSQPDDAESRGKNGPSSHRPLEIVNNPFFPTRAACNSQDESNCVRNYLCCSVFLANRVYIHTVAE